MHDSISGFPMFGDISGDVIKLYQIIQPDYRPLRILKSGIATIVFWQDGTKTVVKRGSDEAESDYAAFTAALGIKIFGSNSALKRIVIRTETQEKKPKAKAQRDQI